MTAVQNDAQIASNTLAEISPAVDIPFRNPIEKFFFWVGRTLTVLPMRISETASGGIPQVAQTFKNTLRDAVLEARKQQERGEVREANISLYCAAYDLTLLNQSQIRAISTELRPSSDQLENSTLIAAFKRAELLSRIPEIQAAIRFLMTEFNEKVQAALPYEEPLHAPQAPRGSRPLAAVHVAVAPIDRAAAIESQEMPSPATRHANRSGNVPNVNPETLVLADFTRNLRLEIWDSPDYTAVEALGAHLEHFNEMKVAKLLKGLKLVELLFLYEVAKERQSVIVTVMAEKYEALEIEQERQKFRAYLNRYNKTKQGVDYDALLAKMRT